MTPAQVAVALAVAVSLMLPTEPGGSRSAATAGESHHDLMHRIYQDARVEAYEARRASRVYTRRQVEAIVRVVARAYGIPGDKMVRVARCESHLDPYAVGGGGTFLGAWQHHRRYWPARASRARMRGFSAFDPWASTIVTARMVRASGWRAWPTCGRR